jgi:hypothetical protein
VADRQVLFEVSYKDISELRDDQLRELVAALCRAELSGAGLPVSAVTAGGNHLAPDGGIDVRVAVDASAPALDFIPRSVTGIQAKHEKSFGPAKVREEMAPKGTLRTVIEELADVGGAYVIVNCRESLADRSLGARRKAMVETVACLPNHANLKLEYFDASRLADWTNRHPGVVLWVLDRLGRATFGYRPFGAWSAPTQTTEESYLVDETARVVDCTVDESVTVSVVEGLERIRQALGQCRGIVRLVGLSGMGKTRFAQALFDERIGDAALDPRAVVYTDIADEPDPSAREVLARLAVAKSKVVLIVDNCGPDVHRTLTRDLLRSQAQLSLLTIEFDVTDDEPDETEVFRLTKSSNGLIHELLKYRRPQVSILDRGRIADWSDGNTRLALSIARTLRPGESISRLSDRELFERLFHQRQGSDPELEKAAEAAALVYSFDVETAVSDGAERPLLARLAGQSPEIFHRQVEKLLKRGLVQKRGKWRAVLPQAFAHHLAKEALGAFMCEAQHVDES